jgi:hypothetical protein
LKIPSLEFLVRVLQPDGTVGSQFKLDPKKIYRSVFRFFDLPGLGIWFFAPTAYRQACRLHKAGRYDAAAELLRGLTARRPTYAPAYFRLGLGAFRQKRWREARDYLAKALELWPWRRRWKLQLADAEERCLLFETYRPQVVLYLTGMENVAYQGNMWIPVMEKLDARVAIVTREEDIADGLVPTKLPVFFMSSMRQLELLQEAGVRTILYPGNTQKNVQTLRFNKLNHFFINHGESDKSVNQSKFMMAYDKLLVAGPLAEQRLEEAGLPVRPGQVVHVGRPPVELLLTRPDNLPRPLRRILYAPTWEGFVEEANYASVSDFGLTLLQALAADNDRQIVFKPHPYTGSTRATTRHVFQEMLNFCRGHGIEIVDGRQSIYKRMEDSDLLITDISSTIPDYLYTLKPMVLTNPAGMTHEAMHAIYPSSRATYILDRPAEAAELVSAINREDTMLAQRRQISDFILGDIPEGGLSRFNRIINESVAA